MLGHKDALQKIADALLAREVLDGEQVTRLVAGQPLGEAPASAVGVSDEDVSRSRQKERTPLVPALNKPIPQE
jgi:hypothetical protein